LTASWLTKRWRRKNFAGGEDELITQTIKSYLKKIENLPREKKYNRVMGFLLRRGFGYDKAKKAITNYL